MTTPGEGQICCQHGETGPKRFYYHLQGKTRTGYRKKTVMELDKYELLCLDCHRIEHEDSPNHHESSAGRQIRLCILVVVLLVL